ncbi:hypothetical protein EMIHUDRAFT_439410, partial [Emiliania huxleyi CCMP1516]|uniref:Uncharacterized protein n=2 Tax=Emiliania huxleyi TaxID=2903 RepID=A0A0D3HXQ7_EMIH1
QEPPLFARPEACTRDDGRAGSPVPRPWLRTDRRRRAAWVLDGAAAAPARGWLPAVHGVARPLEGGRDRLPAKAAAGAQGAVGQATHPLQPDPRGVVESAPRLRLAALRQQPALPGLRTRAHSEGVRDRRRAGPRAELETAAHLRARLQLQKGVRAAAARAVLGPVTRGSPLRGGGSITCS